MSGRERFLLILLGLVVLPLGLWFLAAVPLMDNRDTAIQRLIEERELEDWVNARDAEWRARGEPGRITTARVDPVGLSGIDRALGEAGMRAAATRLENASAGGVSIRLDGVDFVDFGRLLEMVERDLGYDTESLRLIRTERSGLVRVELDLTPES
jgi:type II secretory pathway component PulM